MSQIAQALSLYLETKGHYATIEQHRLLRAALAEIEALTAAQNVGSDVSRLQPIDTAPTDGTLLLCVSRLSSGPEYNIGYFDDEKGEWLAEDGYDIDPSDWMSLPRLPERVSRRVGNADPAKETSNAGSDLLAKTI